MRTGSQGARAASTGVDTGLLPGELERPEPSIERPGRASEIVAAARTILGAEGSDALTMRHVAEALGIKAPSLYKHFPNKKAIEAALVTDAMIEIGEATHAALRQPGASRPLTRLLATYRAHCRANAAAYRLATQASFARDQLPVGLEAWAGNPFYVVTGDPSLAQALWSFAHGMVVLELDGRFPPGSDLDATWRAGADAFERAAATG
jgi:AcrR family transcriptional regulator